MEQTRVCMSETCCGNMNCGVTRKCDDLSSLIIIGLNKPISKLGLLWAQNRYKQSFGPMSKFDDLSTCEVVIIGLRPILVWA